MTNRVLRPSPSAKSSELPIGKQMIGNDGHMYVVTANVNGIHRWAREARNARDRKQNTSAKKKSVAKKQNKKKSVTKQVPKQSSRFVSLQLFISDNITPSKAMTFIDKATTKVENLYKCYTRVKGDNFANKKYSVYIKMPENCLQNLLQLLGSKVTSYKVFYDYD